ncbi:Group II intron-encoded protein LtrA [Virgibacillus dokdonensis]|uniref:Group II intron-encoded protein LtrA n=1 Tax=Virgibacillus dokdonensis TaxID=302167 RepID=A0A2K9IVR9_9BACI|nr:Group II intron-encoded protein LtrA [Virgibacillus dokdonensis]
MDADIKGFFDNVDHKWMMDFLRHRIKDPNFLRIIARFLKAGYIEEGKHIQSDVGTPQGGNLSPILANIYLHYVLDIWFERIVRKQCKGQAYMVRYADDFVCCFQYQQDAQAFYRALKQRLKKFNLEIAENKTNIIPFGRFAGENSKRKGLSKPGTFDFLGFTHYCSRNKTEQFRVKRKTSKKKVQSKLKKCKEWLKFHRNKGADFIMDRLKRSLVGYYNYYCITDNTATVDVYRHQVIKLLFKWLNRRSQKRSFNWGNFELFLRRYPLPRAKVKESIYDLRNELTYIL